MSTWLSVSFECVHFVATDSHVEWEERATREGLRVFAFDCSQISDKKGFLLALAAAMGFPDYFGENWNAVDECLRDLSWAEAPGYVLFVHGSRHLWAAAYECAGMFVECWLTGADEWARQGVPFHLFFVS